MAPQASFPPGVYAPTLTWFSESGDQEIDYELQEKHIEFLIDSGLTGIVVAGSNGEAVALTNAERLKLIRLTRKTAIRLNRKDLPIIIGTVGQSTREIVSQLHESKAAGADYALVLTPSYFHFAMNASAIQDFFTEVADASPIPILLYSWPLVTSGLDLNSDIMSALGRHPNIVGTKLTCGGIAKVSRITAEFNSEDFSALAGHSDWLLPALSIGAVGCISGFANLCPKSCVEIYHLFKAGKTEEAKALQRSVAQGEWALTKGGINGTKWVVAQLLGYDTAKSHTRRPYPVFSDKAAQEWTLETLKSVQKIETSL